MPADAPQLYWYIPFIIFFARICDVSLGTIRTITVVSGHRYTSAALGFCEVAIWVAAVGSVVKYLPNPFAVLAFAGGFSVGTLVGMFIEDKIAIGYRIVRVINPDPAINVTQHLRSKDFRVTHLHGQGRDGSVEIAFTVIRRRYLKRLLDIIDDIAPKAFVSVERAERAHGSSFDTTSRHSKRPWFRPALIRK